MKGFRRTSLVLVALASMVAAPAVDGQQVPPPTIPDYGWLADGRRFAVGDIITVMVDEFTAASADRRTDALEDRSTDAGVALRTGSTTAGGDLGSFLGHQSTQRGRDVRQDRLNSEVTVRVTEVEDNGALRIEGTKTLIIDDHEQEVTVRGVIRPQDITSQNTIDSWRVADAEVLYATEGELGKPKRGLLSKILAFIIP